MYDALHYIFVEVFLYFTGRILVFPFYKSVQTKENQDISGNNGWNLGRLIYKEKKFTIHYDRGITVPRVYILGAFYSCAL